MLFLIQAPMHYTCQVLCLRVENYDLTPTQACVPILFLMPGKNV